MPLQAATATAESVTTLQQSIDALGTTVSQQQQLVSRLSSDIGIMANTLTILTGHADFTGGSSNDGVALVNPTDSSPSASFII